ncbi:MAG: iron ABC transporter permease, partial [Chloroflexota bacterium]|nr:iron ABC transporter permease [Chloroflexota bacterium]
AMKQSQLEENYSKFSARKIIFIIGALIVLAVVIPVSASWGAASVPIGDVLRSIGAKVLPFLEIESVDFADTVVWDLRLPRIVMAIIGGAGLALAGATMQGILRNPLASPFTLGISAAAGFGAALAIVLGAGVTGGPGDESLIVSNAFVFALIAAFLVFMLARLRGLTPVTLILAGIAVMYLFSALTSSLQYIGTAEEVHSVVFWIMGSLTASSWSKVLVVAIIFFVCLPLLIKYSWDLNAMAAGDETATALGTNIRKVRAICMVLATLITASVVAFNGVIGFICLVSPHITRMIIGGDHRYLMPASCIVGGILLLIADTLARTMFQPSELPIGIMTAFIGVPFFIYLILITRKEYF